MKLMKYGPVQLGLSRPLGGLNKGKQVKLTKNGVEKRTGGSAQAAKERRLEAATADLAKMLKP